MSLICSSILCIACKLVITAKGKILLKSSKQQKMMFFTSLGSSSDWVTISHPANLFLSVQICWGLEIVQWRWCGAQGFHPSSEDSTVHTQRHLTLVDNFVLCQRKGNFHYEVQCEGCLKMTWEVGTKLFNIHPIVWKKKGIRVNSVDDVGCGRLH